MSETKVVRILNAGKTAAELANENPLLLAREYVVETDTKKGKWGPGFWNSLPYDLPSKTDLELDRVDNTSDAEKPLSDAAIEALVEKADLALLRSVFRPVVEQHPEDQSVIVGDTVTFLASAVQVENANLTIATQWQRSDDQGETVIDIPGETSTSLTFDSASKSDAAWYRAAFSNELGVSFTSWATLEVVGIAERPAFVDWLDDITIYDDGTTDFDKENYKLASSTTVWISPTGNDTTGDGTEAKPWRTFGKAFGSIDLLPDDTATIMCQAGVYNRQISWGTTNCSKSLNVIAVGGKAIISKRYEAPTWTVYSGSAYTTTRSAIQSLRDEKNKDSDGVAVRLVLAADATECVSTPGSYYVTGSTLYVHLFDGREPDSDLLILGALGSATAKNDVSYYLEGLVFEGGTGGALYLPDNSSNDIQFTAYDCEFRYGVVNNFRVIGHPNIKMHSCRSYGSDQDGFNYQAGTTIATHSLEIGCDGFSNGIADNNDNGSTTHGTCRAVRIKGRYFKNRGPNVVDVDKSNSWNYYCESYLSTSTNPSVQSAFLASGDAECKMYVENCVANDYVALQGQSAATLYRRNVEIIAGNVVGNVVDY